MANSHVGYIALLRQLASFAKVGWVGDRYCDLSMNTFEIFLLKNILSIRLKRKIWWGKILVGGEKERKYPVFTWQESTAVRDSSADN